MNLALGIYIWTITTGLIGLMIYQHARRRVELLSLRNFALLGFLIFQVTSATFVLVSGDPDYPINDSFTVVMYLAWVTAFLLIFLGVYRWAPGIARLAARIPVTRTTASGSALWAIAIAVTVVALVFRFAVFLPYISTLAGMTAIALASVAAGLAGWIWAPRLFNPMVAVPALLIVAVNAALAQGGEFGRRPLVSVGAGMVWGLYYSWFRNCRTPGLLLRLAIAGTIPAVGLAAYTSVRSWRSLDLAEQVRMITQYGDVEAGLLDLLSGQDGARRSMFLMEEFDPDMGGRPARHLMTVRYFFAFPVPRAIWPGKPYPLSTYVADFAQKEGVRRGRTGVTVGPGVIGHAAGEVGVYALIIYAVLGGLMLAFFDRIVILNTYNPFVVLPLGAALGQVMGLARGETSVFAFNWIWSTVTAYILLIGAAWFLRQMGLLPTIVLEHEGPDEADAHGAPLARTPNDDNWDDYGRFDDYGDWNEPDPGPAGPSSSSRPDPGEPDEPDDGPGDDEPDSDPEPVGAGSASER